MMTYDLAAWNSPHPTEQWSVEESKLIPKISEMHALSISAHAFKDY